MCSKKRPEIKSFGIVSTQLGSKYHRPFLPIHTSFLPAKRKGKERRIWVLAFTKLGNCCTRDAMTGQYISRLYFLATSLSTCWKKGWLLSFTKNIAAFYFKYFITVIYLLRERHLEFVQLLIFPWKCIQKVCNFCMSISSYLLLQWE